MKNEDTCPCKSGKPSGECCGPIIAGTAKAKTPEALMRARYSSYVTGDVEFLKTSATKAVQEEFDEAASKAWSKAAEWHGLRYVFSAGILRISVGKAVNILGRKAAVFVLEVLGELLGGESDAPGDL